MLLALSFVACTGTGDIIGDTGGSGDSDGEGIGDEGGLGSGDGSDDGSGEGSGEGTGEGSGEDVGEGSGEGSDDGGDGGTGGDEPLQDLADADAVLWGVAPGDFAGSTVAFVGDVTGDGEGDILVGVPTDDKGGLAPGGVVVVPGPLSGEFALNEVGHWLDGSGSETAGLAIAGLGDIVGDGHDAFAVGAPYSAGGGVQRGAVYIFDQPVTFDGKLSAADVTLVGASNYALAGWSLGGGGDVDGDGTPDLVVGAKWQSAGSAFMRARPMSTRSFPLNKEICATPMCICKVRFRKR